MNRRNFLLVATGLALAPAAALADTPPLVPLKKVFPYLEAYLKVPAAQRAHVLPAYYFLQDGRPSTAKAFIVEAGGARSPLALAADGRATHLPNLAQLLTANLAFEGGAGKFGVRLELHANVAPAARMEAHDLEIAIAEANIVIAKVAGAMSFAAPKMAAVEFVGSGPGQGVLADGRTVALPAGPGGGPLYNPAKTPGVRTLTFARAPSKILLRGKG